MMRLILASASPRRRELLTQVGLTFDVIHAHIDETRRLSEEPTDYVERLAIEKARVVQEMHAEAIVIGADTTVVLDGEPLGKPSNRAEAERMLRALAGRQHQVYTGIAVRSPRFEQQDVERTNVFMAPILSNELDNYLASGDSFDKAGAYGIQGYAARWIWRIEGDFFNVVGLPIAATMRLVRAACVNLGIELP